jgi:hypothetical protein
MGGVSPETCWASHKYAIKFWYTVASCWIFFLNYKRPLLNQTFKVHGTLKLYKTGVHIHRTSSMLRIDVTPCYNKSSNSLLTDLGCFEESSLLWYDVVSTGTYRRFGISCCLHLRGPCTDHITLRMETWRSSETSVSTSGHRVMSQKPWIRISTAVRGQLKAVAIIRLPHLCSTSTVSSDNVQAAHLQNPEMYCAVEINTGQRKA